MSKNEWKILAELLSVAKEQSNNSLCDDYDFPDTLDNRVLTAVLYLENGYNPKDIEYKPDKKGMLWFSGTWLFNHFERIANEMAGETR